MKFLVCLFAALFFVFGIARAETLSSQAFTEAAAAAARTAMPSAQVTVKGDLQLETRSAAGGEITTDLHNAYETYLRTPDRRDEIIHSFREQMLRGLLWHRT